MKHNADPDLKARIDKIQSQIDLIVDRYLPHPPENLSPDVYDVLAALIEKKEMLVDEI